MEKPKESFIFNIEWYEVLKEYPPEIRLELYEAIIDYCKTKTLPEISDPLARMAFLFIKHEIDEDREQ